MANNNSIKGFEFPVFNDDGKATGESVVCKYDYNSLDNIPETCVEETVTNYKIKNNAEVTENLTVKKNAQVDGASLFNGMIRLTSASFGEAKDLPTDNSPDTAGRIFFVKLEE